MEVKLKSAFSVISPLGEKGGFYDHLGKHNQKIKVKSFPNPNVIQHNFNQGILLTEGCAAQIIANKIDHNYKANIALGGESSGLTRIKYNYIENSLQEGVFVIDGQRELVIEDNIIENNHDGIVLVNSEGQVKDNVIKSNQRSGIMTCSKTAAYIDQNTIEDNLVSGIVIKDPSLPILRRNQIQKNFYQLQMERNVAEKKWRVYQKENPQIVGQNEIPKATCNIF